MVANNSKYIQYTTKTENNLRKLNYTAQLTYIISNMTIVT